MQRFLLAGFTAAFAAVATMWAPAQGMAQEQDRRVHITGTVSRGESFNRELPGGLAFKLQPHRHGWIIWIGDPAYPAESYGVVATPPYRGIHSLALWGFHFRNSDNTGPNERGPKHVSTPGKRREFRMVLNRADYRSALDAIDVLLRPLKRTREEIVKAENTLENGKFGHGVLRVKTLELGNLKAGERAWIERVTFTLDLAYAR